MKNRSFISIFAILFAVTFTASSCDDMLTPELKRYSENYAQDSVYSAFGILKSLQNVGSRSVLLDAARSDLSTTGIYTSDSIKSIADFENPEDGDNKLLNAADYYHIINSCNFYMARVDTLLEKNGVPEMKREYAQIQAIRAWTYLQLVRFYGSVPFITEPVATTEQATYLEKNAPRVNKTNLADMLLEAGLYRAYELQKQYGMPNYGEINNGYSRYTTLRMFVPIQLVLGDAYLMQNQYQKAAETYYDYLTDTKIGSPNDRNEVFKVGYETNYRDGQIAGYTLRSNDWAECMKFNTDEQLFVTIGAANSTMGKMLTDVAQTFGFKTSSTVSGSSGSVSVEPNESYQQILPSKNYLSLNEQQHYCKWESQNGVETIIYFDDLADGRLYGTAPEYEFTRGEKSRIIDKYAIGSMLYSSTSWGASSNFFSMQYYITLYRKALLYLRFAEAINRMGFPQIAFGVLKDGLWRQTFPTLDYKTIDGNKYYINKKDTLGIFLPKKDEAGNVIVDSLGVAVLDTCLFADGYAADTTLIQRNVPYLSSEPKAYAGGMYYVTLDEMVRAEKYKFLSEFWTKDLWNNQELESGNFRAGIHSRGCGNTGGHQDTVYTYAKMVAKKVAANRARLNGLPYQSQVELENRLHIGDMLLTESAVLPDSVAAQYADVTRITDDEIINAVEDLIIDECALETAFEGHRFTDLLRFADHKTDAGMNGNDWFAWKMARRNNSATDDASMYDAGIYAKMQDDTYKFFQLPKKK